MDTWIDLTIVGPLFQGFPITVPRDIIRFAVENIPISLNWAEYFYLLHIICLCSSKHERQND